MNGEINIKVKTESLEFELKFDRNVTFIRGNSGTGKTYFCDLVQQALNGDRGVSLECDRDITIKVMPVDTLTDEFSTPWNERLKKSSDTLFIIDEECDCLKGKPENFSEVIKHTSNYYVIVSRKTFSDIPYSVHSIYELSVKEDVKFSNIIIRNQQMYRNFMPNIVPSIIVTEDSGSGYLFFSQATGITVQSAKSKTKVYKVLSGLINQNKNNILLIVDGAAFGPEIEKVKQKLDESTTNVAIYMPESFEWFILHSLQFECDATIQLKLIDYLDLIDYTKFFSVERYFTAVFKDVCKELGYCYDKSKQSLPAMLLSRDNMSHLLKMIPNIKFSTEEN